MQPQSPTFNITLDVGMPENDGTVLIAISAAQPVFGVQGVFHPLTTASPPSSRTRNSWRCRTSYTCRPSYPSRDHQFSVS